MTSRGLQCEKNRHEEMIMENKRTGLKKIVGTVLILLFRCIHAGVFIWHLIKTVTRQYMRFFR